MVLLQGRCMGYPIIVCFAGGTAGDIITQILDPSDQIPERQQLKKPHLFSNDNEKNLFLTTTQFKSIPSHDYAYHSKHNHKILGISCREMSDAIWAAKRFKELHRPQVWKEMTAFCGADTVESYALTIMEFGNMLANYTNNLLYLDDIINGNAINQLKELGYDTPGEDNYKVWLTNNEHNPKH